VLLDVRFLIERLSSSLWAWTTDACERLLAQLGLQEAESLSGRRDFRAPSGLSASLYSLADGTPNRIEFPFPVPASVRTNAELVTEWVDLAAWPLKAVLGEPTGLGQRGTAGHSWTLPAATIRVQAISSSLPAADTVALIIGRPGLG